MIQPRRSRTEACGIAFALVLWPLAAWAVAGPYYFTRPFWSDEVLSWLIATDPSFDHSLAALAGGVDTNAPLLHLLFRLLTYGFGPAPIVFRTAALVAMATAIGGLYATLRRSATAAASAFGCLVFASLPIIIAHATEARFYAFELAAAVWTNLWLLRRRDALRAMRAGPSSVRSSGRGRPGSYALRVAIGAVALCGFHYFGLLTLASLVIAHVATCRSELRKRLDVVWPTVAGFAMTLCLLPLVFAQRSAMRDAGGTWVPDDFWTNLRVTVEMLLPAPAMLIAVVVALLTIARLGSRSTLHSLGEHRLILLAAVVYVVGMLAFDRLVQPIFVPRYFIVALPAVAAVAAALASQWRPSVRRFAIAAVVICLFAQWSRLRVRSQAPDGRAAASLIATVEPTEASLPIVSDWFGHALPIVYAKPTLADRIFYVADPRLHEPGFDSGIRYEREMAACVQRFYIAPRQTSLPKIAKLDRFILLTEFPETIPDRFPGYARRELGTVAFELSRPANDSTKAE